MWKQRIVNVLAALGVIALSAGIGMAMAVAFLLETGGFY